MKTHRFSVIAMAGAVATALLFGGAAAAQQVSSIINADQRNIKLAQESQDRIDKIVDETRSMEDQYRAVMKELDGLNVYNQLLQKQVSNQDLEITTLGTSIDDVTVIERQIRPLMLRMIEGLQKFVELDVPFLIDQRRERVGFVADLMERSDVTVAEQFRQVMEAFKDENDYGRTISTYVGELEIDGAIREVDFLRIGRLALLYQTKDASSTGAWDQANKTWVSLGADFRSQVRQGLRIARQQVAPDLVLLPVPPAEDS